MRRLYAIVLLFGLTACSHDASRENPLDPGLTPPTSVELRLSETRFAVDLTWMPYAGETPFGEYRVQRRPQDDETWTTLAIVSEPTTIAFSDTTLAPNTAYAYTVQVVNAAGLVIVATEVATPGIAVGPVALLTASTDTLSGTVRLRWTRFRDHGFDAYEIHRREAGAQENVALASLPAPGDTAFVDTTARAGRTYEYQIAAVVGGEAFLSNALVGKAAIPAVDIEDVAFDARTATAHLSWAPYDGPRFDRYRVQRTDDMGEPETVGEVHDLAVTTWTDTGLVGNTEYHYHIEVATTADESVAGDPVAGRIHPVVGSWPLQLLDGGVVRLYPRAAGVTVTQVTADSVMAVDLGVDGTFGPVSTLMRAAGRAIDDLRDLNDAPARGNLLGGTLGHVVDEGDRWLLNVFEGRNAVAALTHLGPDGSAQFKPGPDVEVAWPAELPFPQGRIALSAGWHGGIAVYRTKVTIEDIRVTTVGQTVLFDEFETRSDDWDFGNYTLREGNAELTVQGNPVNRRDSKEFMAKADPSWHQMGARCEFRLVTDSILELGFGTFDGTRLHVVVDEFGQSLRLTIVATDGSVTEIEKPLDALVPNVPFVLSVEIDESAGLVRARIDVPWVWHTTLPTEPRVASLAPVSSGILALSIDNQLYSYRDGSAQPSSGSGDEIISQLHAWDTDTEWLGLCLPQANQVLIGLRRANFLGTISFPALGASGTVRLGKGLGSGPGQLATPLSLAGAHDGRVYVLDGGNQRIVVFDTEGNYITHIGGADSGLFDFGVGYAPEDFAGSIAVDDEGYIYVADVGNGVVRKFAP